jgi:cobalt-precorrin 5A hydrolase/precorrin-3B C17-methyltransferase
VNVLSVSVTSAGAAMAAELGYEHVHGSVGSTVRARWHDVDAFVLFLACGAAVRIVAPLLTSKLTDPAVVCVDEAGRFVIALSGAHERGGNDLARSVAAALGATPVITTASEVVVGVGSSSDAPATDVRAVVEGALDGLTADEVATIDRRGSSPGVLGLGLPVRTFSPEELAAVDVPSPSSVVADAVGTPSVAEAAALLAAGPDGELLVPKQKNASATAAVAKRPGRGHLSLVGLGPGSAAHRTPAATAAVRGADVVIGYGPYVDLVEHLAESVVRSPIGDEVVRAKEALALAGAGKRVALVCSGDSGVYAMASIVLELADDDVEIEVVPGVTAALASAAAVGAPLGHDHCAISLSDLLTPWSVIEQRVRAAAEGDFVVSLYNPRSRGRDWQLGAALSMLAAQRPAETPVALVTDAGRAGERVVITTLAHVEPADVGMTTCVIVGASNTRMVHGRMVTPRGYAP